MLSDRAIQLIAELKIEAAIAAGDFEKIEGLGKPFEFDELQYDPNWWVRRKVKREEIKKLLKQKT